MPNEPIILRPFFKDLFARVQIYSDHGASFIFVLLCRVVCKICYAI